MENQPPIKDVRVGNASVTVWENEYEKDGNHRVFLTASVTKQFVTKEGDRKNVNSFTLRELKDALRAIQEAIDFMTVREHETWRQKNVPEAQ